MSETSSAWGIGWRRLGVASGVAFVVLLGFFAGRDDAAPPTVEQRPAVVQQLSPEPPASPETTVES